VGRFPLRNGNTKRPTRVFEAVVGRGCRGLDGYGSTEGKNHEPLQIDLVVEPGGGPVADAAAAARRPVRTAPSM
jgi:hypothetical protein